MHTLRVSRKGQIVIPKEIRERHGLDRATDLVLIEEGDALVLRKKEDVETILEGRLPPLLRAAEAGLGELWGHPEDEIWNDV